MDLNFRKRILATISNSCLVNKTNNNSENLVLFADPSFQQQQQPFATAPPPQNVRVIVTTPVFGEKPVRLQCPNCHADIRTTVDARQVVQQCFPDIIAILAKLSKKLQHIHCHENVD